MLVAGWLLGTTTSFGFSGGSAEPSMQPGSLFACDPGRPGVADFDQNGIEDRVVRSDKSGSPALRLLLNDSQQILLEAASPCRIAISDLDGDRDVDLVALSSHGELEIWRNDHGVLRLLRPKPTSRQLYLDPTARLEPTPLGLVVLAPSNVALLQAPAHSRNISRNEHTNPHGIGRCCPVSLESYLPRPPPISHTRSAH
jgi:hypothetical protein